MSEEAVCFICGEKGKSILKETGRIDSIREASIQRDDNLHCKLGENVTVSCHTNCLSTYCSRHHIERQLKRAASSSSNDSKAQQQSKRLRGCSNMFNFREHCLFCGLQCLVDRDERNPSRWKEAYLCRTADRGGRMSFKEVILLRCNERNDEWSREVSLRVHSAISDLHAADARYHKQCRSQFFSNDPQKIKHDVVDDALHKLTKEMLQNETTIWNSVECYRRYQELGGTKLQRRNLTQVLPQVVGNLLVLSSPGMASMFIFRSKAASALNMVSDEDDDSKDSALSMIAQKIRNECRSLKVDSHKYSTHISMDVIMKQVSPTLLNLLQRLDDNLNVTMPAAMIGSIVTKSITNINTPLQLALAVALNQQKSVVNLFSDYGVTCNYSELRRFRGSAAVATADIHKQDGLVRSSNTGLIQVVADNFDVNISSQNGLRSTHGLAMIVIQKEVTTPSSTVKLHSIPRLQWGEIPKLKMPDIAIQRCTSSKNHEMPLKVAVRLQGSIIPRLQELARQTLNAIRCHRDSIDDVMFFKQVYNGGPEFNGWNTKVARDAQRICGAKTHVNFLPLIDMIPSHPDTIKTALCEAIRITKKAGQEWTVFTNDQQLYKVAVQLTWSHTPLFDEVLPRLGGMHFLMSFVGAVGTLMAGSGLDVVLNSSFAGVKRMLSGHKFPQNVRALRLVAEEIMRDVFVRNQPSTMEEFLACLEPLSAISKTSKLWIDCLLKPVLLMMKFVRAEREGDWLLHLHAAEEMIPYFFAGHHTNYARYGLYYLRTMQNLPPDLFPQFMKGEHVSRMREGVWNGVWTDQLIESTYMRFGKGPGGIIGVTLNPSTLQVWALSMHACGSLLKDMHDMKEGETQKVVTCHKEESVSRVSADCCDREKIRHFLATCIDPLNSNSHPSDVLVNISNGKLTEDKCVNVHNAVEIGKKQSVAFEQSWPTGFYNAITKTVKTIALAEKTSRLGHAGTDVANVDHTLIYARTMCLLSSSRDINMDDVLEFELAPVPTALFNEAHEMRAVTKSALKSKLSVAHSSRKFDAVPLIVIIDACAMLWCIPWPAQPATISSYVAAFTTMVKKKLSESQVLHVVFDRYYKGSIKGATRNKRRGCVRHHVLSLTTPIPTQQVILNSSHNKAQLIQLLVASLQEIEVDDRHRLIVTGPEPAPVEVGKAKWSCDMTHEEADVSMVHIVIREATAAPDNHIRVVSDDTDVLVLLAHHVHAAHLSADIAMEECSGNRSVISINDVVRKHKGIMDNLLAAYALTGCDTTSGLYGIGKGRMLKVLENYKGTLQAVGDLEADDGIVVQQCNRFVAQLYHNGETDMNGIRGRMWKRKMGNKSITSAPKLCSLPPTAAALKQHYLRAHIQTAYWRAASQLNRPAVDPTQFGWMVASSQTGDLSPVQLPVNTLLAPNDVLNMVSCGCHVNCSGQCGCRKHGLRCTGFCKCDGECDNGMHQSDDDSDDDSDNLVSPE